MIIVTGGAGFIGSALIAKLNAAGISDIIVVDSEKLAHREQILSGKRFSEFIDKEVFIDRLRKDQLPTTINAIFHLGACSSTTERNVEFLRVNNIEYSQSIIEYCARKGIRCIYASSAATYGDGEHGYSDDESLLERYKPLNAYGDSKQLCDLWAKREGYLDRVVGLKFFNVYGPNEYYKGDMASIAWKAFNTIKATGSFSLFKSHRPDYLDGEQKRDFVYVKDCCDVMLWLMNNRTVNGIFNVGSGKARSWNDLLRSIFSAMNIPPKIVYIDMPESLRNQYQYFTEAPMQKLIKAGYTAPLHSLEDGVRDYIQKHLMQADMHW
ncbi:MAG: ADP-glyceromanno-heptose 6-epimerase [Pseudomonadota bacterium]|jgi:ADP-L-glycero-D-manno-heptose 6-epimerase